jgi:hypothetical protein
VPAEAVRGERISTQSIHPLVAAICAAVLPNCSGGYQRVNLRNKKGRAYAMKKLGSQLHNNRRMWQKNLYSYHYKIQNLMNYRVLCRACITVPIHIRI